MTAIKPTFTSAASATANVGEPRDSGQSQRHLAAPNRERPVPADAADSGRPIAEVPISVKRTFEAIVGHAPDADSRFARMLPYSSHSASLESLLNPSTPSRTALVTSLMRAVHSRNDPMPLLSDTWGDRLIPESAQAELRQRAMERLGATKLGLTLDSVQGLDVALRSNPAYAGVILRSRYAEDALKQAVASGIVQYVIIGAGFDSFICRRPAWAECLTIIEVDHPATQRLKRERLAACGVVVPSSVEFVEADLSTEALETALKRSSFRGDRLTFFSWLGVTTYLTREANLQALRSIATCAPPGSEMVFTYVDEVLLAPDLAVDDEFRRLRSNVAAAGEAFLSGFDPRIMKDLLLETELLLLEDLNGNQAAARYDAAGLNAFRTSATAHIAHVRRIDADQHA